VKAVMAAMEAMEREWEARAEQIQELQVWGTIFFADQKINYNAETIVVDTDPSLPPGSGMIFSGSGIREPDPGWVIFLTLKTSFWNHMKHEKR
jgi:hypothetical protein